VVEGSAAKFRAAVEDLGLLKPDQPFTDEHVMEYFQHFYEFVRIDGEYTMSPEYAAETVRHIFDPGGPYAEIRRNANVPPDFVILQRISLGLMALFGELNATGNWRRIAEELWPWENRPPSTLMGEAIAAWTPGPVPSEVLAERGR